MHYSLINNFDLITEQSITIRLIGEFSYFSSDLLNLNEDDLNGLFFEKNELIFQFKNGTKQIYFSEFVNNNRFFIDFLPKKFISSNENPLTIFMSHSFTNQKSIDKCTTPCIIFTPITEEMKDIRRITLCIDFLLFVSNKIDLGELSKIFLINIYKQIIDFKKSYIYFQSILNKKRKIRLITLNYQIEKQILTLIVPEEQVKDEEEWRRHISEELKLQKTLQRTECIFPPTDVLLKMTCNGEKLINPHLSINTTFPESHCVKGRYTYYHYLQDNFNDKGWGCAYRSLQTIISWYVWQGWSTISIPQHKDIQMSLVKMKDKEQSFINSRSWIGSFEINLVLLNLLNVESRIISLTKGSDLESIYEQLSEHFDDVGSPVMIGGGQLAHTIIGVSKDKSSKIRFLILDPHYTGLSKDLSLILGKGWCGWKELSFWKDNLPYNLCLPTRPNKN